MTNHLILFEHRGENSCTPRTPVAVWHGQANLEERKIACLSWDDDRLVDVARWEVREICIPDWLNPEEWVLDHVAWRWLWGFGADPDWPEAWQRGLRQIDRSTDRLACIRLLKTRAFRSGFRRSLRDQLVRWLETPASERQYDNPFSRRQWESMVDRWTALEAKRLDEVLYWSRDSGMGVTCETMAA